MSGSPFFNPTIAALLGAGGALGQAAMPSRMPISLGAALGMAGPALEQGAQAGVAGQMREQQVQQARLQNQQMGLYLNALRGLYPGGGAAPGAASGGQPGPAGQAPQTPVGASLGAPSPAAAAPSAAGADPYGGALFGPQSAAQWAQMEMLNPNGARAVGPLLNLYRSYMPNGGGTMLTPGGVEPVPGALPSAQAFAAAKASGQAAGALPFAGPTAAAKAGGTEAATAPYEKPIEVSTLGPDGVYHNVQVPLPAWAASNGAPPAGTVPSAASGAGPGLSLPQYEERVAQTENAMGNPAAPNASGAAGQPASSAIGNGQFLNGTWVPLFKQTFPQLANLPDQQILAMRANPNISGVMIGAYARANAPVLMQAGQPVNAATLGMAHNLGAAGAISVLQAPAQAPLSAVLSPAALQANPTLANQTAGAYRARMLLAYGQAPVHLGLGIGTAAAGATAPASAANIPGAIQGAPEYTPEQSALSKEYGEQAAAIAKSGIAAPVSLERLDILHNAADFFRPGATGEMRQEGQKILVDMFQTAGMAPPDWVLKGAAAGETIGKIGGYLAAAMTRSLGSREAAQVFQAVRNIQPNIEMSSGGYDTVLNSIKQGILRDQDLYQFQEKWLADPAHSGSIRGMTTAFDKQFPMQAYASRVIPYPLPGSQKDAIPNTIYRTARGPALWNGKAFVAVPNAGATVGYNAPAAATGGG